MLAFAWPGSSPDQAVRNVGRIVEPRRAPISDSIWPSSRVNNAPQCTWRLTLRVLPPPSVSSTISMNASINPSPEPRPSGPMHPSGTVGSRSLAHDTGVLLPAPDDP